MERDTVQLRDYKRRLQAKRKLAKADPLFGDVLTVLHDNVCLFRYQRQYEHVRVFWFSRKVLARVIRLKLALRMFTP